MKPKSEGYLIGTFLTLLAASTWILGAIYQARYYALSPMATMMAILFWVVFIGQQKG